MRNGSRRARVVVAVADFHPVPAGGGDGHRAGGVAAGAGGGDPVLDLGVVGVEDAEADVEGLRDIGDRDVEGAGAGGVEDVEVGVVEREDVGEGLALELDLGCLAGRVVGLVAAGGRGEDGLSVAGSIERSSL